MYFPPQRRRGAGCVRRRFPVYRALPASRQSLAGGRPQVEGTRELFGSRDLRLIASSELAVECFHASGVLLPNLRANAENARLIAELGGSAMIVHTDGLEQVTPASLDPIARALVDLAEATEDVDIAVEFNASPVVKSLQSGARVAEIADHPRVGVLFDTAHYHVTPTKLEDVNAGSMKWIKHVHLNDMPDIPADLTHRDFDRVLPGEGVLDLPGIISALEDNGYEGYFAIELFNAVLWARCRPKRRLDAATRACCRYAKNEKQSRTCRSKWGG